MQKHLSVGIKGFLMGAANVVPGVSGGTIALITGIYNEIIEALNSFLEKDTWKALLGGRIGEFWKKIHGGFILALGVGVLASIFSLAKLMEYVLANHPIQTWAFFFGLIIASAIQMLSGLKRWKAGDVVFAVLGAILGVVICTLSPTETPDSMLFLFICGAISICTMILPGISGSFILVILGKYDFIMSAISSLDIPVLLVFGSGCLVGILAFAKFLHWLLGQFERQTMLVLTGFIIGSLIKVWPWSDKAAIAASQGVAEIAIDYQIPSAILWALVGIALVLVIERAGKKFANK